MKMETDKTVGLVLGGGASRGWAHVGVIEALEEACQTYEQAFETYALISQETINIASQSSNALGKMNDRFRARTDALTARRANE